MLELKGSGKAESGFRLRQLHLESRWCLRTEINMLRSLAFLEELVP